MESIIILKVGTAHIEANYSIVEIVAFLCDFYKQESGAEKVGGCHALFWVQQQHVRRGVV